MVRPLHVNFRTWLASTLNAMTAARKNRHALIAFGEAKNATTAFALIGKVDLKEGSPIQEPRHRLQRLGVYCQS